MAYFCPLGSLAKTILDAEPRIQCVKDSPRYDESVDVDGCRRFALRNTACGRIALLDGDISPTLRRAKRLKA